MTTQAPIPARMLNEWTYCPRLGILEWVHGEFAHSADTVDGAWKHRRADKPGPDLPKRGSRGGAGLEPDAEAPQGDPPFQTRSLWLTAASEGITAKLDVVEVEGGEAVPVDTKRGRVPDIEGGVWEPERVQLCAQALVLREHGYRCERGFIYYADSRRRVEVPIDEALVDRTRSLAVAFRAAAEAGELPPPLESSRKCPRCSLVGICLPDETRLLAEAAGRGTRTGEEEAAESEAPRALLAPRLVGLPLYVSTQGARIGLSQGVFKVWCKGGDVLAEQRVRETSVIGVFGGVQVTTQALRAAMRAEIPVSYFSYGGWFSGIATAPVHKNVVLRQAQYAAAADETRCLAVARAIVRSKIRNQRTLLRRNHPSPDKRTLTELTRLARVALRAPDPGTLLGLEGSAARLYFEAFPGMLKSKEGGLGSGFDFKGRNRRPPRDPVNAMLSFAYSILARDLTATSTSVGLDPYLGLYHQPRYGKPALALDLMEEFRPLVADSVVLSAINNGAVTPGHFVSRANGCNLTNHGRKAFLAAYERRMDQLVTHPIFDYRASWRRVMDIQARLLGRHLLGEIPAYTPMETR